MKNLSLRTHKEILLHFLDDEQWHSMPELMRRFQNLKGGAFWGGMRARISDLKRDHQIHSRRKKGTNYSEHKLIK